MTLLFESYDLAGTQLPNRIVMAPMTRARALDDTPDDLTALYYAQRSGAGLIVGEGAPVSKEARGFLFTPGLFTDEQAAGWRKVTDTVHGAGGRIFAQLWHVGRVSHTSLQPEGKAPVSSSARRAEYSNAYAYDDDGKPGMVPASTPRALETEEVSRVTQDFVHAARAAINAGFDGVEIHGANGYLFEQFINGALNQRDDRYGGSVENRAQFLLETVDAVIAEVGASRLGVRISPFGRLNDLTAYEDEAATWLHLAGELDRRALAYVHLSQRLHEGPDDMPSDFPAAFRQAYRGTLIAAGGFDEASATHALEAGELDLIGMGRPFIANPDLVERMKHGWPLATPDKESFYGFSGARGYVDFPAFDAEADRRSASDPNMENFREH